MGERKVFVAREREREREFNVTAWMDEKENPKKSCQKSKQFNCKTLRKKKKHNFCLRKSTKIRLLNQSCFLNNCHWSNPISLLYK